MTGYADLAIKSVAKKSIVIERKGNMPVPVYLEVTYDDGSKENAFANPGIWKNGNKLYTVKLNSSRNVRSARLGNLVTPDANPEDNVFSGK